MEEDQEGQRRSCGFFLFNFNYPLALRYIINSRATMGVPNYCPINVRVEIMCREEALCLLISPLPLVGGRPFVPYHRRPGIGNGGGGRRYQ